MPYVRFHCVCIQVYGCLQEAPFLYAVLRMLVYVLSGADTATAQHVLEAHAWDLNRSVEFFLEQSAAPVTQLHGLRAHAVSIDEDDEVADPTFTLPVPATRIQGNDSPLQARPAVPEQHEGLLGNGAGHDDELRRALAESARDAGMRHHLLSYCPIILRCFLVRPPFDKCVSSHCVALQLCVELLASRATL